MQLHITRGDDKPRLHEITPTDGTGTAGPPVHSDEEAPSRAPQRDRPGLPDPPLPFTGGRFPVDDAERAWAERRVLRQMIVFPALSLAVLIGGFHLGLPAIAAAGVIGLGLTAFALGAQAVTEQRLVFIRGATLTPRAYRYFIYEGFAAVPYGLALAGFGLVLGTVGALALAGVGVTTMRSAVLARPHLALLPAGALLLLHGLGFVIGFRRTAQTWSERLDVAFAHFPALLGGVILVTLAVGTLLLGVLEWLRPEVFRHEFQSLFGNPWPFDGGTGIQ